MANIFFNKPYLTGTELVNKQQLSTQFAGDGLFTKICHDWLEDNINCNKSLLLYLPIPVQLHWR